MSPESVSLNIIPTATTDGIMGSDCPSTVRTTTQGLLNSDDPHHDRPNRTSIEPSRLSMQDDNSNQHTPITLTCHNITYVIKSKSKKKQILFDVSSIFQSGMNAILGKIEVLVIEGVQENRAR
jgi:hypothetical protein